LDTYAFSWKSENYVHISEKGSIDDLHVERLRSYLAIFERDRCFTRKQVTLVCDNPSRQQLLKLRQDPFLFFDRHITQLTSDKRAVSLQDLANLTTFCSVVSLSNASDPNGMVASFEVFGDRIFFT